MKDFEHRSLEPELQQLCNIFPNVYLQYFSDIFGSASIITASFEGIHDE
ncbi:MAG: hypothetical protein HOC71_11905 [Candidatus Latescibacteria bacterium]|nr:hypothetical protein [Candidatus Latescibacterota bacterium]